MKAQTSRFVSPLANLCYKMLFRHRLFDLFCGPLHRSNRRGASSASDHKVLPAVLVPWIKQLSYFLIHFPDVHSGIEPLRRLERSLLRHTRTVDGSAPGSALHKRGSNSDVLEARPHLAGSQHEVPSEPRVGVSTTAPIPTPNAGTRRLQMQY